MEILDCTPRPKRIQKMRGETWKYTFLLGEDSPVNLNEYDITAVISHKVGIQGKLKKERGITVATNGKSFTVQKDWITITANGDGDAVIAPDLEDLAVGEMTLQLFVTKDNRDVSPIFLYFNVLEQPIDSTDKEEADIVFLLNFNSEMLFDLAVTSYYQLTIQKANEAAASAAQANISRQEFGLVSNNSNANQAFKELLIDWTSYDGTLGTRDTTSSVILHGWGLPSGALNIQTKSYFGGTQQSLTFVFSQLWNGLYYAVQKGIKVYILLRDISLVPSSMYYNLSIALTNNVVEKLGANPAIISLLRTDTLNTSITTLNTSITTINANITTINSTLLTIPARSEVGLISDKIAINTAFKEFYIDWSGYNNAYGSRDTTSSVIIHGWGITSGLQIQIKSFFNSVQVTQTYLLTQQANGLYYGITNGIKVYILVRDITLVPPSMTFNLNATTQKNVVENINANPAIASLTYISSKIQEINTLTPFFTKKQEANVISDKENVNNAIKEFYIDWSEYDGTLGVRNVDSTIILHGWGNNTFLQVQTISKFNNTDTYITFVFTKLSNNIYYAVNKGIKIYAVIKDILLIPVTTYFNLGATLFKAIVEKKESNPAIFSTQQGSSAGTPASNLLSNDDNVNNAILEFYIDWSDYNFYNGTIDFSSELKLYGWGYAGGSFRVSVQTKDINGTSIFFDFPMYESDDNIFSRSLFGIDMYAILGNTSLIPSEMEFGQTAVFNKNIVYNKKSNSVIYHVLDKKEYDLTSFKSATTLSLDEYVSNPNNGLIGEYHTVLTNSPNAKKTADSLYVSINDLIDNTGISTSGSLNNPNIQAKISSFFASNIDFSQNVRYTLRLPICWNASSNGTSSAILVDNTSASDGKSWIWMPLNMYNYLKTKTNALITTQNTFATYPTTQNVVIPDFRSPEVKAIYEAILSNVKTYLDTTVTTPTITSSNNYTPSTVKRGDFISHIQIRYAGDWGEGNLFVYNDYSNSNDMIAIVELYKKYFYEYQLIAPSFGTRNENCSLNLRPYQYYLLTTTYGGLVTDSNGLLFGNKEFGYFIDHMTNEDTIKDFSLTYTPALSSFARNKWKKAPITGENGNAYDVSESIGSFAKYLSIYRYSYIRPWGFMDVWSSIGISNFKNIINLVGYRIAIIYNRLGISGNNLNGTITLQNLGMSLCYEDFWKVQIVTRDKVTGSLVDIFSLSDTANNISTYLGKQGNIDDTNFKVITLNNTLTNSNVNVFFRIVDQKRINENLFLINSNRNTQGEYCVYSNSYPIVYNLNGGANHINNLGIRYLYEEFIPKPATKTNAIFDGWYLESGFINKVEKVSVNYLGTVTLYAKFINTTTL